MNSRLARWDLVAVDNVAVALLTTHTTIHTNSTSAALGSQSLNVPKLERPKVDTGISLEDWNVFYRRWNVFREGSNINETNASIQFFQCANETLGDSLLKVDPNITSQPFEVLVATMKALAVVPIAIGVLRSELLEMRQGRDEQFRQYAT